MMIHEKKTQQDMMMQFIPARKIQKSKVKRIQKADATGLEPAAAVATLVCYS